MFFSSLDTARQWHKATDAITKLEYSLETSGLTIIRRPFLGFIIPLVL